MSKVRAHGYLVDRQGKPVIGRVFFYAKVSSKVLRAVLQEKTQIVVGPGTPSYRYTDLFCDAVPSPSPGFFDLPGGLEPGEYVLHIHHGDKRDWGYPFVVTDGLKPQTVTIGENSSTVNPFPFKERRKILLFGDSDSSPKGETLSWRRTDITDYLRGNPNVAKYLNCNEVLTENCAQGATPVYPSHMDHDGVTQVKGALSRIPDADVAICRYGLNDCHAYMQTPTATSRAKFHGAYSECINLLKNRGLFVILVKIQLEKRAERRAGILAANDELVSLSKEHNVLLVDPSIEWENDKNVFHTDGIHLIDSGQRRVALAIEDALSSFTGQVDSIPPAPSGELDIKDVEFTYDPLDIASWKETAVLNKVTLTGVEGDGSGKIKFDWIPKQWPQVDIFGQGSLAIGCPVVIVNKNGKWYGASFTWLRPNQTEKGRHEIDDPTIKRGPLIGWKPKKGEKVYFLIAGLCREGERNIQERTNMVPFIF